MRSPTATLLGAALLLHGGMALDRPGGPEIFVFYLAWSLGFLLGVPAALRSSRAWVLEPTLAALALSAPVGAWWAYAPAQALPCMVSTVVAFTAVAVLVPTGRALGVLILCSSFGYGFLSLKERLGAPAGIGNRYVMPLLGALLFGVGLRRSLLAKLEAEDLAEEMMHLNTQLEAALAASDALAVTRERTRLARELHDSLGHCLTNGAMQLEAARRLTGEVSPRAERALDAAQVAMRSGLQDLRSCVSVLREDGDRPLSRMLRSLVEGARRPDFDVSLEIRGAERPVETARELACFRALQEGLTNAAKHSGATRVQAVLEYTTESIQLRVRDNGRGARELGSGHGLVGLEERATELGGEFGHRTAPGDGFALELSLPAQL
ncbi:MAG: sensor histidine kinase [Myxococcota bacterium]